MSELILGTFLIFLCHWIFDFILQDGKWAERKSYDTLALGKHTLTYSVLWLIPMFPLLGFGGAITFVTFTLIFHTLTDYFTSKGFKYMIRDEKYSTPLPNLGAFTLLGFDQLLHYLQLYITFLIILL